ncbi:MAG TPA: segregation/condensation protein A [Clostridiales bacterium]|jgi:segregation and condensation protein A|nr:segregation/condensation protein A [Clostridiales bacterium]
MAYKVKLDIFEGPLDLLVYLIERAEMNIYDIQVAVITDQYLEYLDEMCYQDLAPAADFMVMAATLIDIKSRMLLPRRATDDPEALTEDPRSELVDKILEYKKYKQAAELLEQQAETAGLVFTKAQEELADFEQEQEYLLRLKIDPLMMAFKAFLDRQRRRAEVQRRYSKMEDYRMTVRSRIHQLKNMLTGRRRVRFTELFVSRPDRYQVVLTFLSVLEMIRRKGIKVRQDVNFGEMTLTPTKALAGMQFDAESEFFNDEAG